VNLRDLAEGQACVACSKQDGTIVLAHYTGVRRGEFGGGLGLKVSDAVGAHLCSFCHEVMDRKSRIKAERWDHSELFLSYCAHTWIRLVDNELVRIGKK
jgi:hypothetical protein